VAIASLYLGSRDDAVAAYAQLTTLDPSSGAAASADFALSEGRLGDAATLLEKGLVTDRERHLVTPTEVKLEMQAELALRRGDKAKARELAALVTHDPVRMFHAALVLLAADDEPRATATITQLATELAPSRRAMAKMIEGEALRIRGKPQQAVVTLQEAARLADTSFAHFLIARAALDGNAFTDAYSELKICDARRGEAAIGQDDIFSYRYVPPITYYLAKAQEGIGSPEAPATYRKFLAMMHDPDPTDPLVVDARKHAGAH
jgi:hypothetical protein